MRRAAVPLALVTLFVLSCAPLTVPSPRAPSAGLTSPPATPIPTDVPASLPIGALPRIASVERDDVRLTVELDRNPLSIGEPTWATATVTNTGTDDLVWFHDGCAVAVGIGGTLDGVSWRRGAAQTSKALAFKHDALSGQGIEDGTINLRFEPERFVGKTRYGCGDIGRSDTVAPGASLIERARWDGQAQLRLGPPPAGRVDLVASFRYYWRTSRGEPDEGPGETLDVRFTAWLAGSRGSLLHPAEAVDVALTDPRLTKLIAARDIGHGNEAVLRFDPGATAWQVGLLDHGDHPVVHLLTIDSRTAVVTGFVEREWDFDVDGYP